MIETLTAIPFGLYVPAQTADLLILSGIYFAPSLLHMITKTQSDTNRRLFIAINLTLGWTGVFWIYTLYKSVKK
ncbi:MAG: superinfection immunity protein [Alphaproteobacteria bacterium]|nr:superinfection immunity protein [Alphaproteobacteria bacterium]